MKEWTRLSRMGGYKFIAYLRAPEVTAAMNKIDYRFEDKLVLKVDYARVIDDTVEVRVLIRKEKEPNEIY